MKRPDDKGALYYRAPFDDRVTVIRMRLSESARPWYVHGEAGLRAATFATFDEAIVFATGGAR